MSFGEAWKESLGSCDKKTTFEILDYFKDNGGNFIDTSPNYQDEESETWIGEWMKQRGVRDEMVLATKFTTAYRAYKGHDKIIQSNFGGNNAKSIRHSVDASLRNLQTDYIDLLWLHWWDYTTSIPELMHALNDLVVGGKVIYLGASDTPAWVVSKANEYARARGLRPFVVYQGQWSAASRDFEREIIPMCRAEGMGICPWGTLGSGNFKTDEQRASDEGRKTTLGSKQGIEVSKVLEKVAKRRGTIITSIALAYVMHKTPYVFPIVGGRKVEHLKGNIEALGIQLTWEDMEEIEAAVPFDLGFPNNFLVSAFGPASLDHDIGPGDMWLANMLGRMDYVQREAPIPGGLHNAEMQEGKE